MIKNNKNSLYLSLISILLICLISLGLSGAFSAKTMAAEFDSEGVEKEYLLNEYLEVPAGQFSHNGTNYAATPVLHYPDGSAYSDSAFLLDVPGEYRLEYSALINGGKTVRNYYFNVTNLLYGTTSNYGLTNTKSDIKYDTYTNSSTTQSGLEVALAKNETFYYREAINFSGKTAQDDIVKLFLNPSNKGTEDATRINIVFTDKYDANNSITITAKTLGSNSASRDTTCYFTANSNKQLASGLEAWSGAEFLYEGRRYRLHQGTSYGTPVTVSLRGTPVTGEVGSEYIGVRIDYSGRRVYINNGTISTMIIDLNEASFFGNLWEGFSNDEAYLSIVAENYQGSHLNMFITDIDDHDISVNSYSDSTAPDLTVDLQGYTENNIPNALLNTPYPIFNAFATDMEDGDLAVDAVVYYAYNSNSRSLVSIIDGKFIPKLKGLYTILYTAKDLSGNIATKKIQINAATTDIELELTLGEKTLTGKAGSLITVATPAVNSYYSKTNVSISAINLADGTVYKVQEDMTFRPLAAGTYTVKYDYSDFVSLKTESYDIEIAAGTEPAILDKVSLPRYMIKGASYILPQVTGYEFTTGSAKAIPASIMVSEEGKEPVVLQDNLYTPGNANKVVISYVVNHNGSVVRVPYPEIQIVDVGQGGKLDMTSYFVDRDNVFTAQASSNNISFTATTAGKLDFVNSLLATDFSFSFAADKTKNNYSTVNLYLTDANDSNIQLKLSFNKIQGVEGKTLLRINDDISAQVNIGFLSGSSIVTGYKNDSKTLTISDFSAVIGKDMNGADFAGFPSNLVNMTIEVESVTGSSAIIINRINNQSFFQNDYDGIGPQLTASPLNGDRRLHDTVNIKAAYAKDVLDSFMQFTMLVTAPDGSVVISSDGITLNDTADPSRDYLITLNQYGAYNISFSAMDSSANVTNYSYIIRVVDTTVPTIELSNVQTTAKVNKSVTVAAINAKDDLSEVTVKVYVRNPEFITKGIEGNTFTPSTAGTYTVFYYVFDQAGNTEIVSYDIVVS